MTNTFTAHIFVPLYNVNLDMDIHEEHFSIISTKTYFDNYRNMFEEPYRCELERCLIYPEVTTLLRTPTADCMLVRKIELPIPNNQNSSNTQKILIDNELINITEFIGFARLYKKGIIQIGNYYLLSPHLYHSHSLTFSTSHDDIKDYYNDNCLYEKYDIKKNDIYSIIELKDTIYPILEKNNLAIVYFNSCYMTGNLYDKLLKLVSILEMTILNGTTSELNYRLQIRASTLLEKDVSAVMKRAYNTRSQVSHNGCIKENAFKNNNYSNFEGLFFFLKDELEPLVREIVVKFLTKVAQEETTAQDVASELDKIAVSRIVNS